MRTLGWADYLSVEMSNGRKTLTISYWMYVTPSFPLTQLTIDAVFYSRKQPPPPPGRPPPQPKFKVPLLGGKLIITIVKSQPATDGKPARTPKDRVLAELQQRSKLGGKRPSDEVEIMKFDVKWEPEKGALGVTIPLEDTHRAVGELRVVGGK